MRIFFAAAFFSVMVTFAMATDFTQPITDLEGRQIMVPAADGKGQTPVTLSQLSINALNNEGAKSGITGEKKFELFELAQRVHDAKSVQLSAEDVATLKKVIGEAYSPIIVGRAWEMLDPNSAKHP